ncbi:MAG TPA: alpha-ketoacid dehydrogenase subunit beta [Devosiaceae bacterium]
MRELTVKDAINEALRETMRADPDVVLFGEDIAGGQGRDDYPGAMDAWGGPFGVTKGLCTEFGRDRVRDTTIAEAGFFGAAIGGAMVGMRPVCELMYADFAGVCFDQMMNQAAKMRYMFGGKQNVPMVMRTVVGGGFRAGAEHSQTLYSLFAHIPGLKVVAPYSAADAKGLLISAIRDDDPVVFFEHKRLYMQKEAVPEGAEAIPLGRGRRRREGGDVTVIAVQRMNLFAEQAAAELERDGIGVEIIDPRTYAPLDEEMILSSVKKTGRAVVVDESYPRCSLAADIAALIAEKGFADLRAPVLRVTAPHTPVPFSPPMEDYYLPSPERIARRVREAVEYGK